MNSRHPASSWHFCDSGAVYKYHDLLAYLFTAQKYSRPPLRAKRKTVLIYWSRKDVKDELDAITMAASAPQFVWDYCTTAVGADNRSRRYACCPELLRDSAKRPETRLV